MPKRKHGNDEFDNIAKKIKLLTEELRQARPKRRRRIISSSSSSSCSPSPSPLPTRNSMTSLIQQDDSQQIESHTENDDVTQESEVVLSESRTEPTNYNPTTMETQLVSELDEETLLILGEDPSIQKKYGKDIQAALAIRFQHIATSGLTKEQRKELQDKHLPPANCTLVDGPMLNPEIKAAVSEIVAKRDKGIENKQKQMANAISCIGEAITMLISSEDKNPPLLQLLMDAGRLMCDCQHTDTTVRRNFILNNLKKDMKDQLQLTKIDKYLFGQDFADTLKSAKAINKSIADLKTNPVKPGIKKPPAKPSTSRTFPNTNLNWKAPSMSRRQPGSWSQKSKEPVHPKMPHASSSRTSYSAPSRGRR